MLSSNEGDRVSEDDIIVMYILTYIILIVIKKNSESKFFLIYACFLKLIYIIYVYSIIYAYSLKKYETKK